MIQVRINRYAPSNKWGDAMCGYASYSHEGIETASPLMAAGMAFTVPFDDPDTCEAPPRSTARSRSTS